ncbi:MAG: hypothetical protein Q4C91_01930 [Eubacteriales bacterium]|nr:hypothetical protein [Eubacteriales bacterium]
MFKGIYFMGWYRDMWNYHPSLPMKNQQMVEDAADIHADMLIWSCMGSGAIGLPYLDREANDEISPRLRLYGFMNDSEFCEECRKRGIKVFSVLWKAQLWEFGAEFNNNETELLSLNLLRNASANHGYIGMSELSVNKYPHIFSPIEKYFPRGLLDYKGNKVKDFLQEFKAVSLENRNILSKWLMVKGHDHKCYTPCCNKESYLSYMKRNVEMMIDAGAGGLHIDEFASQKHVLSNAGCFCPECMENFRQYLKKNRIALPEEAGELKDFDYREYLLRKGYKDEHLLACNANKRWKIPLYRSFVDMQMATVEYVIRELSGHAKKYAKETRGEDFPVTANLFQCFPFSWECKKHLDILSGEKTDIRPRQDGWYKFAFGWLNGKESCFVEDPNQYVRDMAEDMKNGINDRFIRFLLEPIAHGFHIAFPYGSWLQNQVKDALWPDLRMLRKLGPWLDEHEYAFPKNPVAEIAVLYDANSAYENVWSEPSDRGTTTYNMVEKVDLTDVEELGMQGAFSVDGQFCNFFRLIQSMSDCNILYNVIFESPDEPLTSERLKGYKTVIVPDAFMMDDKTVQVLNTYREEGGSIYTLERKAKALQCDNGYSEENMGDLVQAMAEQPQELKAVSKGEYGIAWHDTGYGRVLHIVNYQYNEETHRIDLLPRLEFQSEKRFSKVKFSAFPENPDVKAIITETGIEVINAGIYTIVELM